MTRPTGAVFIATSLDGFIAREDGGIDWLRSVELPGEDYGFAAFYATVDALVFGRKTYETALGFPEWPYAGKRCIVLTHRPAVPRHGEEFYAGDPAALVERLGREGCRKIYVDGGATIRAFLAAGIVDEMTISIVPVLLGRGLPLFGNDGTGQSLVLEHSRSWSSGLTQLRYRVTFPRAS